MRIVADGGPLLGVGGIRTYLYGLLRHLAVEGPEHEYGLFFRGYRSRVRRGVSTLMRDPALAGFDTHVTVVPDRVLDWCWTRHAWHIPGTEGQLGHPDLFLSTIYLMPILRRTATIMLAYDLIPMRFPRFYGRDRRRLVPRIRRGLERTDAVVAISEATKRDFIELMGADPAKVRVVYPGVEARQVPSDDGEDAARLCARYGVHRPYLLYVGSLGPHKNVETLVRAFRRLRQSRRIGHQLVLCGATRWGRAVLEAASDLTAAGACVVLDFIPPEDVPCFYRHAEAFVFPSLYEGFGLPVLEAMACGAPVVSSNAGALPEVVGDAGLLVSPTDEEAIEDALHRVLTDPALREHLRAKGYRQAARFDWKESARQMLKLFADVRGAR
ncbi:MAG: glycosyltransferase family 1 protein [Armatimonadota bacterium]|nr:glycosyltransferase family 1 protein [Armatimonadota bacterium]